MSKIDVNNEIVLMRQSVRRARLHVVRKLIKQVKMLGGKKGDEKQREKYKRKADKLGQELAAIKKMREDDVTRYSITNERTLEDILGDQKSDPETCALGRLSSQKIIADRVAEFKEKFPKFEEHLGPGKRKLIKLKRKAGKLAKKEAKVTAQISDPEEKAEEGNLSGEEEFEKKGEEIEEGLLKMEENTESELPNETTNGKRIAESSCPENKRVKTNPKSLAEVKPGEMKRGIKEKEKVDELAGISLTNKEAAVKRFARFLEEKDSENEEVVINEKQIALEKEVDSFFMTEDGGGEYLSVVVPKSNVAEDEEGAERRVEVRGMNEGKSYGLKNNRFFDKVDDRAERRKPDGKSGRDNRGGFVRGDRFRDRNESRDGNSGRKSNPKNMVENFVRGEKSSNENMHPSWAAKKKEQEILKLGFQGKKIVFDDVS